ncbi:two-component sensor histidine kinase [Mesoterricola silvestris]|uniref:histidine kinase n=1 Tax=Mesoterricola silvestris TaxID=2927979 RepID=A0AA48GF80_9BACT|nr:two-component sensor histidine kinase [Mesoterricola silvestris]
MEPNRPDPDDLLKSVQEEEARTTRARLKIFFGMAPGVGKTFAMLQDAQLRMLEGVDVVAGVVETHGRAETMALTAGLEFLPKKQLPYRGVQLEEFDVAAALRRRPALILMDELAHTNVQGSLHVKRWQDVFDLLEAGIDVYSTVNVQHLESLKDTVAQITGVIVRESIPDTILNRADQIELVDIPTEELLERLKEGKVYVPDQAQYASERFFRKGNLLALRELALRRTAQHVDADMRRYMETQGLKGKTWAAGERILVCINSKPRSASLIRAGRRMAESMGAPWIAVYVETGKHIRYSDEERAHLEDNLRLAERLGAETEVIQGDLSTGEDILAFALAHNVTRIILGKPTRSRLPAFMSNSLVDDLVRLTSTIEIHVIPGETPAAPKSRRGRASSGTGLAPAHFVWGAVTVAVMTGICLLVGRRFELADHVMIYMLGILLVATRFGRLPSLAAAGLSVLSLDFFFVPPVRSFVVGDLKHIATFAVMLLAGAVIGNLTERIRAQMRLARTREQRLRALFRLSRELTRTFGSQAMMDVSIRILADHFQSSISISLPGPGGRLVAHGDAKAPPMGEDELGVAQWVYDHHEAAGLGTDTLPGAHALYLPLKGSHGLIGVLGIQPLDASSLESMEPDQRHLMEAFANHTALALERTILSEKNLDTQRRMDREQVRSALLSSVSHDLSMPLAGITSAARALLENDATLTPEARHQLAGVIHDEGHQLSRLVTNLLDATRLESGVELKKEWLALPDLVQSALARLKPLMPDRAVTLDLPPNLPRAQADPVLLEQVLINLLENAHRYSPPDQPIEIKAWATERALTLCVSDHGPGIPEDQEERIFEKLVRFQQGESRLGAGLGLAICKGVMDAHGGKIQASNRPQGGASFRISLPLEAKPPVMPVEE